MRLYDIAISTVLSLCAALALSPDQARAQAAPIACDGKLFQVATSNSTLKRLGFFATSEGYAASLTDVGNIDFTVNAGWGFSEPDRLIYGIRSGRKELWSIDANGVFTQHGNAPASASNGSNAGDILPDGTMIYKQAGNIWQLLDISDPAAPVDLGDITLTSSVNVIDFGLNPRDGYIYGVNGSTDRLFAADITGGAGSTATVTEFGPAIYNGAYGAAWFDEDGRMYVYDNNSNQIFAINVGVNGSGTGNRILLATSQDEEGGINDGAYCRGPAPVPLGSITGTLYADTDGSDTFDGGEARMGAGVIVRAYYDNATPLDETDDYFIGETATDANGDYLLDGLPTIETYRVEVDALDPALPPGSSIGTSNPLVSVSVRPGQTTTDQDFGFDSQPSDLSIALTAQSAAGAPITAADEGDTVVFVLSVTNDGPGSPSGVRVTFEPPAGFTLQGTDAPPFGDIYDAATGTWFVDEILDAATETIRITMKAGSASVATAFAEITASSLPDPDSDPTSGRAADDFSDGAADDDETLTTVTVSSGIALAGRVFLDSGAGGGTAYDALVNGAETSASGVTVTLHDGGGAVIATPEVGADGRWSHVLRSSYSGALTVTLSPGGQTPVSEQTTGLPALSNADARDGVFTFTPAAGSSYASLDFGVVAAPELADDNVAAIAPGQVVSLAHRYRATTAGTLGFSFTDVSMNPANGFTAALYEDTDCDGAADTPFPASRVVAAGDVICLASRVSASGGVGPGAAFTYTLRATTTLSGIPIALQASDVDSIVVGGAGEAVLSKTVRNITAGSLESSTNTGDIGDVLEYRITVSNPGVAPITSIIVRDATPAYTKLAAAIPTPVALANGVDCAVASPAVNAPGHTGPISWNCTGSLAPGATGSVTFRVQVDPL